MTDYSGAINDLQFFENRLKNILEVIPVLTELGSLDNAVNEAKRQIDNLKADIESLGKDKDAAEAALEDAQKVLDNRKVDFDSWLELETKKAKDSASAIVQDAKDVAKSLIEDAKAKADMSVTAIKNNEAVLADLNEKIASANDQYEKVSAKLLSIKNSI